LQSSQFDDSLSETGPGLTAKVANGRQGLGYRRCRSLSINYAKPCGAPPHPELERGRVAALLHMKAQSH
jgi:hypothetical protein